MKVYEENLSNSKISYRLKDQRIFSLRISTNNCIYNFLSSLSGVIPLLQKLSIVNCKLLIDMLDVRGIYFLL